MSLTAERLAEIDAELDAFGKSDEALAGVVERAREAALALSGDSSLGELLEGREEAFRAAWDAAKANLPPRPPSRGPWSARSTAVGAPAPSSAEEDEAPSSGMIEIPEEELRKAQLPPVLELGDAHAFPEDEATVESARPPPPEDLDEAFEKAAASDIHGMSVDELFADAAPAQSHSDPGELADLFDEEEEEVRLSDPALGLESLEDDGQTDVPRPRTVPPPVPAAAMAPPALGAGLFEESDATEIGNINDLLSSDDDFELLVDDDVLELDSSEVPAALSESAPDEPSEPKEEKKGGLISRILGRK